MIKVPQIKKNISQESGFEQVEEDSHVTLTPVNDTHKTGDPTQRSFVSSDFTSKLLNLDSPSPADNEIASLMDTTAQHATVIPEITPSITTTVPPPPPFLHSLQQEVTPTPTPITFTTTTSINPIVTLIEIPNFAFVFKFDQRLREEAQAENQEFLNQVDSNMKTIIKDQVKAQVSKIMPKIEKYVTEYLGAEVLVRSTNQPQTAYVVAASLSEFKLKKILIDKMEANKSINRLDNQNNLYNALDEDPSAGSDRGTKRRKSGKDTESSKDSRSKEKKSSSTSKDASQSQHKSSGKSVHVEEPSHPVEDSDMQPDQEFVMGDNDEQPADKEVTKADWFKKPERPPTPNPDWSKRQQVDFRPPQTWISQATLAEEPPTSFDEFNDTSFDFFAFVMNRLKIPNMTQEILSPVVVKHDQHAYFGTSHWGPKCQSFYGYASNLTSSNVFLQQRRNHCELPRLHLKKYDYGHLEEIEVRHDDQKLYTFKEGNFKRLRLQDIEDKLLLLV
ncbi:hypothetical protein Tco_0844729 [Tanacetum coccineum]